MKVLVVDDEEFVRTVLQETLEGEGCRVTAVSSGQAGIETLKASAFDCVITDLRMPGVTGLALLEWVRDQQPDVDVIMMTGHGDIASAVNAMKGGAWDFLTKDIPFEASQVKAALTKLATVRALRRENLALRLGSPHDDPARIVHGRSAGWQTLMQRVQKVAPSNAPILIQGETGSGKELVARALHSMSPRSAAPFLAVNCGAISSHLLESELFGHEKGAFTDAATAKPGLIAAAEGGTLFLDEIGEMSGSMQVSLLRVLDRGEYRPVGGTRTLQSNVRFVAATNRNLVHLVQAGKFRDDLLYRINTVTLEVPPLRERPEDIAALAEHFLRTFHVPGVMERRFAPEALTRLTDYAWPGNVRELRNVIERLLLLSTAVGNEPISEDELPQILTISTKEPEPEPAGAGTAFEVDSLEAVERTHILNILTKCGGNKSQAARVLRIDYKTLQAKLRKYDQA
jgi:DNA-binding NtrC family response regulator